MSENIKEEIAKIEKLANSKSLGVIDWADSLCYSVNFEIHAKQAIAHTIKEMIHQEKISFSPEDKSNLLNYAEILEKEFKEENDMLKKAMKKLYR